MPVTVWLVEHSILLSNNKAFDSVEPNDREIAYFDYRLIIRYWDRNNYFCLISPAGNINCSSIF